MGIPPCQPIVSVQDYLEGELVSEIRHEYVDGQVFAMAGGSVRHNTICGNFFAELRAHLKGKPCKVFIADVKARILAFQQETFYYPDVMVGCDERDTHEQYRRFPKLIIEVLSESTERLDRREKFERYITIPTLEEYVLVEQQRPWVTIHRRRCEWKGETVEGLTTVLELESVGLSLPLAAFYENVSPSVGES